MLQHRVGVQPQSAVTSFEVDEDYFERLRDSQVARAGSWRCRCSRAPDADAPRCPRATLQEGALVDDSQGRDFPDESSKPVVEKGF